MKFNNETLRAAVKEWLDDNYQAFNLGGSTDMDYV